MGRGVRSVVARGVLAAALLGLTAGAALGGTLTSAPASAVAVAQAGDGTTAATAGASCWGIKQAFPATPSGVYWVLTPALPRPLQVYCDQTTDGGGWVLVGRGREGWSFHDVGQRGAATVRGAVTGSAAFAPATLTSDQVTGIVNRTPISSLKDGIRIQRALNTAGTSYQEVRLYAGYTPWTWAFPTGQRLARQVIAGVSYANGNTRDSYAPYYDYPASPLVSQQGTKRLMTWGWEGNAYRSSFGYGSGVTGSTSASSYVYQRAGGYAQPFARVWLRPRIDNAAVTFPTLPTGGLSADPNPPNLKTRTETAPWGVVGLDHTNEALVSPWQNPANVIRAYGDRVFVGGRFTGVQHGPGGTIVAQKALAAFDLDGNWISTFRPTIAGRVWDIVRTGDGKLIIAGDFTSVNGKADTAGIAALDPTTGAVLTGWRATVTSGSGPMIVRGLDQRGTRIYAVGRFSTVKGGSSTVQSVANAVSLSTVDGTPGTWRPVLSGSAIKVRAAAAGDRVYIAGFFTAVNGSVYHAFHAVTAASNGAPVAGIGPFIPSTPTKQYQQAVAEWGDEILVGGSQHDFQFYNRDRTVLIDSTITKAGGDTQAIEVYGDDIYIACHCDENILQGTNNYISPNGFRSISPIMLVGRFDATTHTYDRTWYPSALKGKVTEGIWGISQDTRGCLWVAGDLVRGAVTGVAAQDWLGNFGRMCPTDSTPPTTPTGFTAVQAAGFVHLSWSASTDAGGGIVYDVYRDDRVIGTATGTGFDDPTGTGTSRYTVRAADASGNRSAAPAPITPT